MVPNEKLLHIEHSASNLFASFHIIFPTLLEKHVLKTTNKYKTAEQLEGWPRGIVVKFSALDFGSPGLQVRIPGADLHD